MNRRDFNFGATVAAASLIAPPLAIASPDPQPWIQHCGVQIWRFDSGAYFFSTQHIAIDADGAPDAYAPLNKGRENLFNSGYPNKDWWNVLVRDPGNPAQPYTQTSGKFDGYYVSKTALENSRGEPTDPRTYVDAESFPYLVIPGGDFYKTHGTGVPGDLVMALNMQTGLSSSALIGDISGADDPLGEISTKLAENLGGRNVDPRDGAGAPKGSFLYAIFPNTHTKPAWPRTIKSINERANLELALLGGWEPLCKAVREECRQKAKSTP